MRTGVESSHLALQVVSSNDLEATYAALSRSEYTWEELQQRPLPPGVDPARIESYLSAEAFQVCPNLCISSNHIFFSGKILDEQVRLFRQPPVEADRDEEECGAFLKPALGGNRLR